MNQLKMKPYTVFCRDEDGGGTTWIGSVQAIDPYMAALTGRQACAEDWGNVDLETIHVIGVAEGDISIPYWQDEGCLLAELTPPVVEAAEIIRSLLDSAPGASVSMKAKAFIERYE